MNMFFLCYLLNSMLIQNDDESLAMLKYARLNSWLMAWQINLLGNSARI